MATRGSSPCDGLPLRGWQILVSRRHDEDWRLRASLPARGRFQPGEDAAASVDAQSLARFALAGSDCPRLVFVNGRFALGLSTLAKLPAGVRAGSLAQTLAADRGVLEPHLARYEDFQHEAFSALNTAFLTDGAFVSVPRGTVVEAPIHILYVTLPGAAPLPSTRAPSSWRVTTARCPWSKTLSLGQGIHFSNAVTEVVVGDGASSATT
jgi:Fe-S cluster assembly protein SufD